MSAARAGLLGLLLATAMACAGPGAGTRAERPRGPVDEDLLALVPSGAELLVQIDVARLRKSPQGQRLLTRAPEQLAEVRRDLGFDPIDDLEQAVIGLWGVGGQGPPEIFFALRGRFHRERVEQQFALRARGQGGAVTTSDHRGVRIFESAREAGGLLTERTLLSGSPEGVRRAIDLASGIGGSARDDRALQGIWQSAAAQGTAVVRAAVLATERLRRRLTAEVDPRAEVARAGGRVDVTDGLELAVTAELTEVERAGELASAAHRWIEEAQRQPALVALGLAGYIERVTVVAQGPRLLVTVQLTGEQLEDLATKIEQLGRLRSMMRNGEGR